MSNMESVEPRVLSILPMPDKYLEAMRNKRHTAYLQQTGLTAFAREVPWLELNASEGDVYELVRNYDATCKASQVRGVHIDLSRDSIKKMFPLPSGTEPVETRAKRLNQYVARSFNNERGYNGHRLSGCTSKAVSERLHFQRYALHFQEPRSDIARSQIKHVEQPEVRRDWQTYFAGKFEKEMLQAHLGLKAGAKHYFGSHLQVVLNWAMTVNVVDQATSRRSSQREKTRQNVVDQATNRRSSQGEEIRRNVVDQATSGRSSLGVEIRENVVDQTTTRRSSLGEEIRKNVVDQATSRRSSQREEIRQNGVDQATSRRSSQREEIRQNGVDQATSRRSSEGEQIREEIMTQDAERCGETCAPTDQSWVARLKERWEVMMQFMGKELESTLEDYTQQCSEEQGLLAEVEELRGEKRQLEANNEVLTVQVTALESKQRTLMAALEPLKKALENQL